MISSCETDPLAMMLDELFSSSVLSQTHLPDNLIISSRTFSVPPTQEPVRSFVTKSEESVLGQWDILPGRGGHANNYDGNKRFRQVVEKMKPTYKNCKSKADKTALSNAVVDYVTEYGGRFLKRRKGANSGEDYQVMTKQESRRKTSQALRETKELKWKLRNQPL
mmetsp:Transcript_30678/g.46462  ORF Transcript_30678/g.46462 Transcript_30678/m.46462 type:complete len:165 (-) Transcript_30678:1188-1682(-)